MVRIQERDGSCITNGSRLVLLGDEPHLSLLPRLWHAQMCLVADQHEPTCHSRPDLVPELDWEAIRTWRLPNMHCLGVFQALLLIKRFRECAKRLFIMFDEGTNLAQHTRYGHALGKQILVEWDCFCKNLILCLPFKSESLGLLLSLLHRVYSFISFQWLTV